MNYWAVVKSEDSLEHYGVKGMKWRHHKNKKKEPRPYDPSNQHVDRLMRRWKNSNFDPQATISSLEDKALGAANNYLNAFMKKAYRYAVEYKTGKPIDGFLWLSNGRDTVDKVGDTVIGNANSAKRLQGSKSYTNRTYLPSVKLSKKGKKLKVYVR